MSPSALKIFNKLQAEQSLRRVELIEEFHHCFLIRSNEVFNITISSLRELYYFLEGNSQFSLFVHFPSLADWIESTIGDMELAIVFKRIGYKRHSYDDKCQQVYQTLGVHLSACYEQLNIDMNCM